MSGRLQGADGCNAQVGTSFACTRCHFKSCTCTTGRHGFLTDANPLGALCKSGACALACILAWHYTVAVPLVRVSTADWALITCARPLPPPSMSSTHRCQHTLQTPPQEAGSREHCSQTGTRC
jgi:hypothetical protein